MEVAWNIISFQNLDKPPPKFQFQVLQEGKLATPLPSVHCDPRRESAQRAWFCAAVLPVSWTYRLLNWHKTKPNLKSRVHKRNGFLLHHLPWSMLSIAVNRTALVLVTPDFRSGACLRHEVPLEPEPSLLPEHWAWTWRTSFYAS